MVLINYYAPYEEKDHLKVLDDLKILSLYGGGDFNLIFDIRLDADG